MNYVGSKYLIYLTVNKSGFGTEKDGDACETCETAFHRIFSKRLCICEKGYFD